MTSHKTNVGSQLLDAIMANDEQEFVKVLDAHYRQVSAQHLDMQTEIGKVGEQIRETERVLGLPHHAATLKMVAAQISDRLRPNKVHLLAA